ncbi:DUF6602 domain-containing protein [Burkholderia gladioli]|uniref:DUF6602 domain-containing protein n=1 Tax=Burkholderia gladioli TaxID=28095 RepID=UPI00163E8A4D|nr:DUF6602 domain-containing protein [Burkholderia gladioli]
MIRKYLNELKHFDTCIHTDDPWENIVIYRVQHITDDECKLEPIKDIYGNNHRTVFAEEFHKLLIYPFSFYFSTNKKHEELARIMHRAGDLVCALLSEHKSLSLDKLSRSILKFNSKFGAEENQIIWIIRCLTAANYIEPSLKNKTISFTLSPAYKAREKRRKFSATIASELTTLSERVRFIIDHGPSVGTYRENLLKNTLRKHLPERYHVATGFIFGLHKQIDLLIYDKIDYAPIFRDEDIVIVPPESVRAVIEVKTTLTSESLESSLELMHLASEFDDNSPPFFKGIFAFENALKSDSFYKKISAFYTDLNTQSQGGPGKTIHRPFQHLTCACVINKAFAYTRYIRNQSNRLVPALLTKSSATNLESQSSFFMQSLLSHLKFGGMKPFKIDFMGRMLGEDTFSETLKDLKEDDDSWGAYFAFDDGDCDEDAVKEMEDLILRAQRWLDGEENFETTSRG